MDIRVVANELKPAVGDTDYRLHCAALEWSLAEPIIINSSGDIKSRVDWKDRVEPYYHQVQNLMRFCRRLPVTLLADDVGLGKTISAGLIISELMKRNRVSKVFVICPKILIPQWIEELESKFGISAYGAVGSELRASHNRQESVIVTTYQSATGFLTTQRSGLFDMLILDEAHKVRNLHGSNAPPKMATAIFEALESRMFKYVVMLTATPIQNRLWDIYSVVDCLAVARGHKNPFGNPDEFAFNFIADSRNVARNLQPSRTEEFRRIVNSYMFRTRRIDAKLAFPDRQVQTSPVNPTPEEWQLQSLIADNISNFNGLQQSSLLVALMSSPHALATQLDNMASNGTAHSWLAKEVRSTVNRIRIPAKTKAVLQIASDLKKQGANWRMVVFTTRKETQRMLGAVLERAGISYGFISGGEPARNLFTIKAFRQDSPSINVVISTDAGAEGVNLQSANILVNYDLPWNPMIVEQRIGRVQRIGSKFRSVWVANIVHHDSPEQNIVVRLMEKLQIISHTVGDIESVLEASNNSSGESLEKQIRHMVVASLKGQNQEEAARKAEMSIEKAKRLIEKHQEEMDRTLGGTSDGEEGDIPMPRLSAALPSMPLSEFVVAALEADGATVTDCGDGLYTARSASLGEERFTFESKVHERFSQPGIFMGRAPLLYEPGKPAFERLVQRWIDRSGVRLEDKRCSSEDSYRIAKAWLSDLPGASLLEVRPGHRRESFEGKLLCRTRVANAVDSYEKLIEVEYDRGGHWTHTDTEVGYSIRAKALVPDLDQCVSEQVDSDEDIAKFRQYYESRLRAELERSDSGNRKAKLMNDLGPGITADASALEGTLTDSLSLDITYSFSGTVSYQSRIEVKGGQVVAEPPFNECRLTQWNLPVDCLEECAVTGDLALRERLKKSELSGEYAMPEAFVICEQTGKQVHEAETEVCSVTQQRICRSLLTRSEMSGRYAVPAHTTACELTHARLIEDETANSTLSGKLFRADESVVLVDGESIAHKSEATKCVYSNNWYVNDDCTVSDVTDQPVAKDRVAYSEHSNRKCDISEIMACEETGTRVLPDELGRCFISNKLILSDILWICPETQKKANESFFQKCEATDILVLPEGLASCRLTGMKVRTSLLGKSESSGQLCMADRLVRCQASGAKLLPSEVQTCEITGQVVDQDLLKKCEISGKVTLAEKLVQSKVTGKWMLPKHTQTLPNGTVVGAKEVAVCTWTRKYLRVENTAVCALSGLVFDKTLLNLLGEFSVLRECLDGNQKGSTFPEPGYLARVQPKIFGGIIMFQWVTSTSRKAHVMFGKKTTFGFNRQVFAVIAQGDLTGLQLKGNVVFGKRAKGIWSVTESRTLKVKSFG